MAVVVLADAALTQAKAIEEATERLITICTRALWILGISGGILAIYGAALGLKAEAE
jgi:hypothetical protein